MHKVVKNQAESPTAAPKAITQKYETLLVFLSSNDFPAKMLKYLIALYPYFAMLSVYISLSSI